MRMRFVVDGEISDGWKRKDQAELEKRAQGCKHSIVLLEANEISRWQQRTAMFRSCGLCGLVAHTDGDFSYQCGGDYCECMS